MPPAGEPLLSLQAVRKTFGGLVAVNDVSFDVRAGEIVGLIGPNGAGKSTIFNLVTGVLWPTRGEIALQGRAHRRRSSPARVPRRGIARTFQHVNVQPNMSVLENVALGAHLRGTQAARCASAGARSTAPRSARLLQRGGAPDRAHGPGRRTCTGRRAACRSASCASSRSRARSASIPMLLLLDEPAAGLRHMEKARAGADC